MIKHKKTVKNPGLYIVLCDKNGRIQGNNDRIQSPHRRSTNRQAMVGTVNVNNQESLPPFEDLLQMVGHAQDRQAYIQIFEYFAPRLKSYFLKQGASNEFSEEIVQDTMIAVWRKAQTYNAAKSKASTWIFTIARNKRIDLLRKDNRSALLSDAHIIEQTHEDQQTPNIEDTYSQYEEAKILRDHIQSLPSEQLELIEMAYFQDKSHQDIANETQLPLGTVKSRIRLALGKLKKIMDKDKK